MLRSRQGRSLGNMSAADQRVRCLRPLPCGTADQGEAFSDFIILSNTINIPIATTSMAVKMYHVSS